MQERNALGVRIQQASTEGSSGNVSDTDNANFTGDVTMASTIYHTSFISLFTHKALGTLSLPAILDSISPTLTVRW